MEFKKFCQPITEQEYRESPRLSYSFLKELSERGPKAITEPKESQESASLTLGSVVDKCLSDSSYKPESEYTVCDEELDLSGTTHLSKICKYLLEKRMVLTKTTPTATDTLNNICTELGFSRFPKFDDALWEQIALVNLRLSDAKLISSADLQIANTIVNSFKTHEFTKDIFNPSWDIEVVNQAAIYFTVEGVECRSLLDKVLIDHKKKIIYPYDIKTGASRYFLSNFFTYKYYYQAALYSYGLTQMVRNIPELNEYTIAPFKFLYLSREEQNVPNIYEMPDEFCNLVMKGYTTVTGSKIKGIKELLDDYTWYTTNNYFDNYRDIYENKGVFKISTPIIIE